MKTIITQEYPFCICRSLSETRPADYAVAGIFTDKYGDTCIMKKELLRISLKAKRKEVIHDSFEQVCRIIDNLNQKTISLLRSILPIDDDFSIAYITSDNLSCTVSLEKKLPEADVFFECPERKTYRLNYGSAMEVYEQTLQPIKVYNDCPKETIAQIMILFNSAKTEIETIITNS